MKRVIGCLAAALAVSMVAPAFAQDQEWDEYTSIQDGFTVDMPGKPQIQTTTWTSQYRYVLPARVYTASHGAEKYSVTVVDYRPAEKLGEERFKQCPKGAETCLGTQDGRNGDIIGLGYWKMDVRGAMTFAMLKILQRDPAAKLTDMNLQFQQVVEGYFLQLANPDGSHTFDYITMHENRLYIFEGMTPKGYPVGDLFQSSVGFVDKDGNQIRYTDYYSNTIHGLRQYVPPPAGLTPADGGQRTVGEVHLAN